MSQNMHCQPRPNVGLISGVQPVQQPVKILTRFEASTDGTIITPAILAAGTTGVVPSWTCSPATLLKVSVSTAGEYRVKDFTTPGETYNDDIAGTRGIKTYMDATGVIDCAQMIFAASDYASIGFAFKFGPAFEGVGDLFAFASVLGNLSSYIRFNLLAVTAPAILYVDCTASICAPIYVNYSTWYWVSVEWSINLLPIITVIKLSDRTVAGRVFGFGTGTEKCTGLQVGRCSTEPGSVLDYIYTDDLVVSYGDTNILGPTLPKIF